MDFKLLSGLRLLKFSDMYARLLFLLSLKRFLTLLYESLEPWYVFWLTLGKLKWITFVSSSSFITLSILGTLDTASFLFPSKFSWIKSLQRFVWRKSWNTFLFIISLLDKHRNIRRAISSNFVCWFCIHNWWRGGRLGILHWGKCCDSTLSR